MNNINDEAIFRRAKKHLLINAVSFVLFFLIFITWLMIKDGFAYLPDNQQVYYEKFKYLHNLLEMPVIGILFIAGVLSVIWGILKSLISLHFKYGIWFTGSGAFLTVFSLFLTAGFNHTAYYPSSYDLQSSLTIINSSSSFYTLKSMAYVSLLIPLVIIYIAIAWRAINKKQMDRNEMKDEFHVY